MPPKFGKTPLVQVAISEVHSAAIIAHFTHCNLHRWCFSIHSLPQTPNLHSGNMHCVVYIIYTTTTHNNFTYIICTCTTTYILLHIYTTTTTATATHTPVLSCSKTAITRSRLPIQAASLLVSFQMILGFWHTPVDC